MTDWSVQDLHVENIWSVWRLLTFKVSCIELKWSWSSRVVHCSRCESAARPTIWTVNLRNISGFRALCKSYASKIQKTLIKSFIQCCAERIVQHLVPCCTDILACCFSMTTNKTDVKCLVPALPVRYVQNGQADVDLSPDAFNQSHLDSEKCILHSIITEVVKVKLEEIIRLIRHSFHVAM